MGVSFKNHQHTFFWQYSQQYSQQLILCNINKTHHDLISTKAINGLKRENH
jgi:hypothetical protein